MKKSAMLFFVLLLFGFSGVHAQDKYSVSGVVNCVGTASIIVSLSTHEEWGSDEKPVFCCEMKLTDEQKKTGRAPFRFDGVSEGRYAIILQRNFAQHAKSFLPVR